MTTQSPRKRTAVSARKHMRFIHKPYIKPVNGDVRTQKKFLLFPKRIKDETRWLEVATWEETCHWETRSSIHTPFKWKVETWPATKWIDSNTHAD